MKILCLIDNLNTGGAQRQMVNLAIGLHRRGHHVSVFCYAPGDLLAGPLGTEGIPVELRLKSSRFSWDVIRNARRAMDQGGCQAVVSFLSTPNFYALVSARLSRTRPAVIVSERFCDMPGYPTRVESLVRQFYRLSGKVVVNSHHQRLNFFRRYPWMRKRLVTIYNGYDLVKFVPPADEPRNAEISLLVVAGVSRYKNGLCLVRALDILQKEHGLRPYLDWAGNRAVGAEGRDYLAQMDDEIQRFGLAERWRWLGQRTDIVSLLGRHDVLVHPSYGEGLPNAVCEAMACGRPVIAGNTLDNPCLVDDGVNGFLFDWRDPADLARKIRAFYDLSSGERRRMGERGRAYAEKNLSLERFAADFERVLEEAIKA